MQLSLPPGPKGLSDPIESELRVGIPGGDHEFGRNFKMTHLGSLILFRQYIEPTRAEGPDWSSKNSGPAYFARPLTI